MSGIVHVDGSETSADTISIPESNLVKANDKNRNSPQNIKLLSKQLASNESRPKEERLGDSSSENDGIGDETEACSQGCTNISEFQHNRWENMFRRLVEFKGNHGHCLVPNRYREDRSLGAWVSTQRRHYKAKSRHSAISTPLTKARVQRLQSVGFVWATTDPHHTPWDERFKELQAYGKKYGNVVVPIGFKENPQLSNWVSTQRQGYKAFHEGRQTTMTQEKIDRLESIGMVWDAQRGGNRQKGYVGAMDDLASNSESFDHQHSSRNISSSKGFRRRKNATREKEQDNPNAYQDGVGSSATEDSETIERRSIDIASLSYPSRQVDLVTSSNFTHFIHLQRRNEMLSLGSVSPISTALDSVRMSNAIHRVASASPTLLQTMASRQRNDFFQSHHRRRASPSIPEWRGLTTSVSDHLSAHSGHNNSNMSSQMQPFSSCLSSWTDAHSLNGRSTSRAHSQLGGIQVAEFSRFPLTSYRSGQVPLILSHFPELGLTLPSISTARSVELQGTSDRFAVSGDLFVASQSPWIRLARLGILDGATQLLHQERGLDLGSHSRVQSPRARLSSRKASGHEGGEDACGSDRLSST